MENQNIITKDKASRAIIIHDDGILLMFRHQLKPTGEIKEYYVTIGGGAEGIETSEQTLHREVMEEAGIEVDIIDLITVYNYDMMGSDNDILRYTSNIYLCKNKGDKFFQTHELDSPESLQHNENNSYEIQKVTWSELPKINLIPKDLHGTIVEYAYKNGYL